MQKKILIPKSILIFPCWTSLLGLLQGTIILEFPPPHNQKKAVQFDNAICAYHNKLA